MTTSIVGTMIVLVLWGLATAASRSPRSPGFVIADPRRVELTAALWSGVFNLSIAAGTLGRGLIVDNASTSWAMSVAAILALLGCLTAMITRPRQSSEYMAAPLQ